MHSPGNKLLSKFVVDNQGCFYVFSALDLSVCFCCLHFTSSGSQNLKPFLVDKFLNDNVLSEILVC